MQNRSSPLASVYFLALAATLAAAIPVLVYLILNHESGDPSASSAVRSIPDAALEQTDASTAQAALDNLARQEVTSREQIAARTDEGSILTASEVQVDPETQEGKAESVVFLLPSLFSERRSAVDNALAAFLESLPAGTTGLSTSRLEIRVPGPEAAPIVGSGKVSWPENKLVVVANWAVDQKECSLKMERSSKAGLRLLAYRCPERREMSTPLFEEHFTVSVEAFRFQRGDETEDSESAGHEMLLEGIRVRDTRTDTVVLSAEVFRLSSSSPIDLRYVAQGRLNSTLWSAENWQASLRSVEGRLEVLSALGLFGSVSASPGLTVRADVLRTDESRGVFAEGLTVSLPDAWLLTAKKANLESPGSTRRIRFEEGNLRFQTLGAELTAKEGALVFDLYQTFDVEVDDYELSLAPDPLEALRLGSVLTSLKNGATELLDQAQRGNFDFPPLMLPDWAPDLRLQARNGRISKQVDLPLLGLVELEFLGEHVIGIPNLSLTHRGGILEDASVEICVGDEQCNVLKSRLGVITDAVGRIEAIKVRFSGARILDTLKQYYPEEVKSLGNLDVDCEFGPFYPDGGFKSLCEVGLTDLSVYHRRLALEPLSVPALHFSLDSTWNLKTEALDLAIKTRLGEVEFLSRLKVDRYSDIPAASVDVEFQRQDCAALFRSIPREFVQRMASARFEGTLSFDAHFSVDMRDIRHSLELAIDGDLSRCRAVSLGDEFDVEPLNSSDYIHRVVVKDEDLGIDVGPGTSNWVPLRNIPGHVQDAARGTEDLKFFEHNGFNVNLIRSALRLFLERGYYAYGGSTLSQQLVKNLFLSREKTLARKFQEAIIVWQMEQKVMKDRILELYINCIEYGPKIWGIRKAASTYFGKTTSELSVLEASFIMGLKPDPMYGYLQYKRGKLNSQWEKNLSRVLRRLREMGAVTEAEHEILSNTPLRFKGQEPDELPEELPIDLDEERPVRQVDEVDVEL